MTCIVGLISKTDSCIYLGGDSAGVAGYDIRTRKDPKVFVKEGFGFGFTTSFRMGQLLMCEPLNIRKQKKDEENYDYVVNAVIPRIRQIFQKGGFTTIKENVEKGGGFILVYHSSLFEIHEDFQVAEYDEPYAACGCGKSYALASLYTSTDFDNDRYRVQLALETAEKFSAGVRSPFNIIKVKF